MDHAILYRPGAKIWRFNLLGDGDRQVLMPRHTPIRTVGLVEKNRPDWKSWGTK